MSDFSTNERADHLMGRRRTDVLAFDQPCELGYWCPVCRVHRTDAGDYDERLHWSEYNGFIWCSACNIDWPSALCVRIDAEPESGKPWQKRGPAMAIEVFLDTVEDAVDQHQQPPLAAPPPRQEECEWCGASPEEGTHFGHYNDAFDRRFRLCPFCCPVQTRWRAWEESQQRERERSMWDRFGQWLDETSTSMWVGSAVVTALVIAVVIIVATFWATGNL